MAVVLLVLLGLIMVYSATFHLRTDSTYFLKRQLIWVALGTLLLGIGSNLDYDIARRFALPVMGLSFLSLVAVLVVGANINNTYSWFGQGSIQPSEAAKVAFIIYIAAWLSSKGDKIRQITYGLIPFSILLGVVTGLILLQPDKGTGMLIAGVAGAMFFVSGAELSQLLTGSFVSAVALFAVVVRSEYALERLLTWVDLTSVSQDASYQMRGVLAAVRAGGLTGRGLGAGVQKFVPPYVYHTDTIFSVIGEELGLLGCLVVIGLFLLVAYRGLMVSFRAPDSFSMLLAFGVTCWFTSQAFVHIGGNTGALPFTGITLPFVSYGGSSLTMSMAAVGLLQSVARAGVDRKVPIAAFALRGRDRRPRLSRTRSGRGTQKHSKR
jgi:cell division protein FtsW